MRTAFTPARHGDRTSTRDEFSIEHMERVRIDFEAARRALQETASQRASRWRTAEAARAMVKAADAFESVLGRRPTYWAQARSVEKGDEIQVLHVRMRVADTVRVRREGRRSLKIGLQTARGIHSTVMPIDAVVALVVPRHHSAVRGLR